MLLGKDNGFYVNYKYSKGGTMIKNINQQGADVLYKPTTPVAPIVRLNDKELTSSLTAINETEIPGERGYTHHWEPEIVELVKDLKDTCESIVDRCFGLASTQVWDYPKECPAIFVMRWPSDGERGFEWK